MVFPLVYRSCRDDRLQYEHVDPPHHQAKNGWRRLNAKIQKTTGCAYANAQPGDITMKCLYHANCTDGSGAALAVWKAYGDDGNQYIPCQYGEEPPLCLKDEQVIIVDFSYKKRQIRAIAKMAKSILIIDHHKTAKAELYGVDNGKGCLIRTVFDMDKSGAVLAWEHFHRDDVPKLLTHIQDRDLWRFELPGTKNIHTGLSLHPEWRTWLNIDLLDIQNDGLAINLFLSAQTEKIINTKPFSWPLTGDNVPVYNLPGFMLSDTLHDALMKYPDSPYAVGYFDMPGKRIYSLRSRTGSNVDVSEIAVTYGGGGHKHAAGFSVPEPHLNQHTL